jgi:hypothetical protein
MLSFQKELSAAAQYMVRQIFQEYSDVQWYS